jgi:hypothetical protein
VLNSPGCFGICEDILRADVGPGGGPFASSPSRGALHAFLRCRERPPRLANLQRSHVQKIWTEHVQLSPLLQHGRGSKMVTWHQNGSLLFFILFVKILLVISQWFCCMLMAWTVWYGINSLDTVEAFRC